MSTYKTIAESNNFIVLDKYTKHSEAQEAAAVYQTEAALEREIIQDLINQGYENPTHLTSIEAMLVNVRVQLQALNNMAFTDGEYAFLLYHDKNGDGEMNRNFLGIPKEAFAFSNNVKPKFSKPTFEECKFFLKKKLVLQVKLDYF